MVSAKRKVSEIELRKHIDNAFGEVAVWVLRDFESEQQKFGWDTGSGFAIIPVEHVERLDHVLRVMRHFPRDFIEVYWALSDAMQFADKCETALVSKDDFRDGDEGSERMCDEGNIRKEKRTALRFCLSGEVDCNDLEKLVYIQEKLSSLFIHSQTANNREYAKGEDYAKWCKDADSLAEDSNENAIENDAENAAANN